ncbi:MAG: serine/threonine-protein kinase [Planctomycetota bacterium]
MLDAPTEAGGASSIDGHARTESCVGDRRSVLRAGDTVDDYRVIREVARGGGGVVYHAKQISLDRDVALKLMLGAGSESDVNRFQQEAEAAARLDHPGIVPVIEVGHWKGRPYFSMAWVEGESLADLLHRGPVAATEAAVMVQKVALAMEYAHQEGFIHRDLKPANILIDLRGTPRVTDFGVCKRVSGDSDVTVAGQVVGTPHFMPPEQAQAGTGRVGYAADVYSLGAVFYAALTGHPPFQAANPVDVLSQVLLSDPIPPRRLDPSLPVEAEIIALKCLSKTPSDRYASAAALADDLRRFSRGEPIEARAPGLLRQVNHAFRRHVLLASVSGTVAIALLCLLGLTSVLLYRTRDQLSAALEQLELESRSAKTYLSALRRPTDGDVAAADGVPTQGLLARKYQLLRWTETARLLHEQGRKETALQVVIHALESSEDAGEEDRKALSKLLDELSDGLARERGLSDETIVLRREVTERLDWARSLIENPVSEFEARLFGLVVPFDQTEAKGSEEPLE